jgi:NADH:ubiquinone oxidoreductase subunit D
MRIREIAQTRVRYGYRKIRVLLNREGLGIVGVAGRASGVDLDVRRDHPYRFNR